MSDGTEIVVAEKAPTLGQHRPFAGVISEVGDRYGPPEYLRVNSFQVSATVESEITAHIAMPAQALTYKTGERTITDLRKGADSELGEGFSLHDLNDELLDTAIVALEILQ